MKQAFSKRKIIMIISTICIAMAIILSMAILLNANTENPYVLEIIDEGEKAKVTNNQLEISQKILTQESDDLKLVYELSAKNVISRNDNIEIALIIDNSYSMKENTLTDEVKEKMQSLITDMLQGINNAKISVNDTSATKLALSNNATNINNAISSIVYGQGNSLKDAFTYAKNSFSTQANTTRYIVLVTDSTDNVEESLIEVTDNNIETISILYDMTNNTMGTPDDYKYGPVYMIDSLDNNNIVDYINKNIVQVTGSNVLTTDILQAFDLSILEQDENVTNLVINENGFSWQIDRLVNNTTSTIKYSLTLKEDVVIDRNIIYKTWYSSENVTMNYTTDYINKDLVLEKELTPTFTVCETYDLKIKAVNEKNTSLPVSGIDFKIEGKDNEGNIVYQDTLTTDSYGYVTAEKIKTLDEVTYSIKAIVNQVGYEDTEERNIIVDNDYLGRRVIEVTSDGLTYTVDDIERIVEVEIPIKIQGFQLEVNLTQLNNNNVKLSNTEFRLIQPKLNNKYEMDVLYATTDENGRTSFYPAVMTKAGTYDYILSQIDEQDGYESMGNVTIRITFDKEGKITKSEAKYNDNVTVTDWNEAYIQLNVGNESILENGFDFEFNLKDSNTQEAVVGAKYAVSVITPNNTTYTYGDNVTDENGQIKLQLPGSGEVHIVITEQTPAPGYQKCHYTKEFTIHRQDEEVKYAYGTNSSATNYFNITCQSVEDKVIVDAESVLKSERNIVKIKAIDLVQTPTIGLENVQMSLVNITNGKKYNSQITNIDGELEFTVDEELQGSYEYNLVVDSVPYGYIDIINPIRFNIHFDENGYIDSVSDIDDVLKLEYQLKEEETEKLYTAYMEIGIEMDASLTYEFRVSLTDISSTAPIEGATYDFEIQAGEYTRKVAGRPTDDNGMIYTRIAVDKAVTTQIDITIQQITTKTGYKVDGTVQELSINLSNNVITHTPKEVLPNSGEDGQRRYASISDNIITYNHTNRKKDASDTILNIYITTLEKTSQAAIGGKTVNIQNSAVKGADGKVIKQILDNNGQALDLTYITSTDATKIGYVSFEQLQVVGVTVPGEQEYEVAMVVDGNLIRCKLTFEYNEYTEIIELINVETVWGNRLIHSKNFSSYENENGYESDINLEIYTDYDATGNLSLDLTKGDLETKNTLYGAKYDIIIERPDGTKIVKSNVEVKENSIELDGVYVPVESTIYLTETTAPQGYDCNDTVILKVEDVDDYTNEVTLTMEKDNYKIPRAQLVEEASILTANGTTQSQYTLNMYDVQEDKFKFKITTLDNLINQGVGGYEFEISNDSGAQRLTGETNENGTVTTLVGGIYDDQTSPKVYTITKVKTGTYYKALNDPINVNVYFKADGSIDAQKTLQGQTDSKYSLTGKSFGQWHFEGTNYVNSNGDIVYDIAIVINVEKLDPLKVEIETINKFTNSIVQNINYTITPSVTEAKGSTNIDVSYAESGTTKTYKMEQEPQNNYVSVNDLEFTITYDDDGNIALEPTTTSTNMKIVSFSGKTVKLQVIIEPQVPIAITNLYYFNQSEVLQGAEFTVTGISYSVQTNSNGQATGYAGQFGTSEEIIYTITQTKAKFGYAPVEPFEIKVTYDENRNITNVSLVEEDNKFVSVGYICPSSSTYYGYNYTDKGIVNVTVLNYKAVTMNINNVDRRDGVTPLAGTEYEVTSDINTNGTGITNADGLAVTYVGKSGFDRTVHYVIKETKPSFGYQSLGVQVELDVDFNEEGYITNCVITNNPSIDNIAQASMVTPIVTIEDNFTINITLKNNPLLKFNIKKLDVLGKENDMVIENVTLEVVGTLDETEYTKDTVTTNQYGEATAQLDKTLDNKTMTYTIKETQKSPFYNWLEEDIKLEISYDELGKIQQENGYEIIQGNNYIDITNVDIDNFTIDMNIYNYQIEEFGIHLYTDDVYDSSKKVQKATWDAYLVRDDVTGHVKDEQYNKILISGRDDDNDDNPDEAYGEDFQILGKYTKGAGKRILRLTTNNNWLPTEYYTEGKLYLTKYSLAEYNILIEVEFDDEGKIVGEPKLLTGKDSYIGWLLDERYVTIKKVGYYGLGITVHYYPMLQIKIEAHDMYTKETLSAQYNVSTSSAVVDYNLVKSGAIAVNQYSGRGVHGSYTSWTGITNALCRIEADEDALTTITLEGSQYFLRKFYIYELQEPTSKVQYQKYRPRFFTSWYDRKIASFEVMYNEQGEVAIINNYEIYSNNNITDKNLVVNNIIFETTNKHNVSIDLLYAPITTGQITVQDEISGSPISGVVVSPYEEKTDITETSYEYRKSLQYTTNNNGQTSWTYWGANIANGKTTYKISVSNIKEGYFGSDSTEDAFRNIEVEVTYGDDGRIASARVLNKDGFDNVVAQVDESCYGTTQFKLILKLKRKMGMQINKVDEYDNNIKLSAKFKITNNIDTSGTSSEHIINTGSQIRQIAGRIIANNTVEYTLSEVTVPDGYKPLDQNLKLIVKYRSNGTIESAYPSDDYSKAHLRVDYICQTERGDNSLLYKDIEITIVNEPKFAVELELTDKFYDNIKIDNVTFSMKSSEGDVAVGNLVTNSSGKIYTYIGAVHQGKTVTYTITQESKASGYYILTEPIQFSVTYDTTGKPVDIPTLSNTYSQEYSSILTTNVTRFRTDYTAKIKVYNMPEKVNLGIVKYDSLNGKGLQNVEFKVIVEENDRTHELNNILTDGNGHAIVQIDTFKEEASGRSVTYTINEVQALDSYRKIQDFKLQVFYDAKGGISSWQVISNDSNLSYTVYRRGNTSISKMDDTYTHMKLNIPNDNTYDLIVKDEDKNYNGLGIEGTQYDISINGVEQNVKSTDSNGYTKLTNLTQNGNIQIRIAESIIGEGYRQNKENDIILEIEKASTGEYSLSLNTDIMTNYTISETSKSTTEVPEYKIDLTQNTYVIVSVNEEYGQVNVTFYNETKLELTLIKQDINTRKSLEDVEFMITSQNLSNNEVNIITENTKTDEDGEIYFDLGVAPQNTTVAYTFTELSQPEPNETYQTILSPQSVIVTYNIYGRISNIITSSKLRTKAFLVHDNENCRSIITTIGNGTIDPKYTVKVVSEDVDTGRRINGSTFDVEVKDTSGNTLTTLPTKALPNMTQNFCTDGKFHTDEELEKGGLRVQERGIIFTEGIQYKGDIVISISQTGFAYGYVPGTQKTTGEIKVTTDFKYNPNGSIDSILSMTLEDNDGLEVSVDEESREIIIVVKNESRTQLTIEKLSSIENEDGTRDKITGATFNITSQILTASGATDTDLSVTTRETGVDGITSEAIGKAHAGKTVVYTISENPMDGYETIEDIQIAVVYDLKGNISYVELLSAYVDILNWTSVADSFIGIRDISISVLNKPIVDDYIVILEKHDIDDGLYPELIPGAEYEITVSEQFGETKTWTAMTNQDGKIVSTYFSGYGIINITIKEITAPVGYELDPEPKYITVSRNKDTGVIQRYSSDVNIDINDDSSEIILKPVNKGADNTYNIIINKIDVDSGAIITNDTAQFEITITKVQEIPAEDYEEPDMENIETQDQEDLTQSDEEDTQTTLTVIVYTDTLEIMETSNGKAVLKGIKSPEEEGTYTYTIKEVKVPEGYAKDPEEVSFEVVFAKNEEGNMFIQSAKKISGQYVSIFALKEQTLGFNLGNRDKTLIPEEDEYILNISKVDEENNAITDTAIFKITMPDGTVKYVETKDNGRLALEAIELPNEACSVVYTIQEIMAPTGYILNSNPIKVEITFEEIDEKIQIKDVILLEGDHAVITNKQENRVDINVINKEGTLVPPSVYDTYTMVIKKLDSKTKDLLSQAKFLLTTEYGQKFEDTTDRMGKITIEDMRIPNEAGVYPYVIKEIEAPSGYKLDSEYKILEITFSEVNGEIKMTTAEIVSGKNVSVTLENNVVTVDVLNEAEGTDTPTTPDDPENPDGPDNPTTPDNPENPDGPDNPTTPDDPENPDEPDTPTTPDDPKNPDGTDTPTTPDGSNIGFDAKTEKYLEQVIQTYTDTNETITDYISKTNGITKLDVKKDRIKYLQLELKYKIVVTNIGDKEGTITAIIDKVPSGLQMNSSKNPGWVLQNNMAIYQLNNTVLKPGESIEVEFTLKYNGNGQNVGNIINYATFESTQEKDMDDLINSNNIGKATFILSVKTGQEWVIYTTLTLTSLGILALGIISIKKYVL